MRWVIRCDFLDEAFFLFCFLRGSGLLGEPFFEVWCFFSCGGFQDEMVLNCPRFRL